jgi:hypothetical protein
MTFTFCRDCPCGLVRRAYRIECPDDARFYTNPVNSLETILIPGPEHRKHPERSVWLRLDDAIRAAKEGRYGLRLSSEEELPRVTDAEVACVCSCRSVGVPGDVGGDERAGLTPAGRDPKWDGPRGQSDPRKEPMIRRRFLTAGTIGFAALVAGTDSGVRGATGDPRFPATIASRIGGKPVRLVLTGTAVRTKYGFRVYTLASYVQEGAQVRDAEGLVGLDAPKQLHLIFERDVDGATMAKAFRESIGRSHPAPAFAAELAMLERHFVANPVKQGDHVRLTHVPGVGLGVQVNGQPGLVVRGVGFARAAWGTYLGQNNLGVAIKTGLTSRLR